MLKLSKKVEYALLAAQYMSSKREDDLVTAKQMAMDLQISFEFLSKCLQLMMKKHLIKSQQGIKGGYFLTKSPDEISLWDIIHSVDEKVGIVECSIHNKNGEKCDREDKCEIKDPMVVIQRKINNIFKSTTLRDLSTDLENNNNYISQNFIALNNGINKKEIRYE